MKSQNRSIARQSILANILSQPLRAMFEAGSHSPSALINARINGFLHSG
jgi:hypothetical protein